MTRIDFYVLSGDDPEARLHMVCKLAEKAAGSNRQVFIHGDSDAQLRRLDEVLWSFRALSYVAHRHLPAGHVASTTDTDPVHLSCGQPAMDRDLLINLAAEVPPFFSRFERTLEIVNDAPDIQQAGRARYRFYQQRGYPLQHHRVQ